MRRAYGARILWGGVNAGLKSMCENCVVPEGTRIYFPRYPGPQHAQKRRALGTQVRPGLKSIPPPAGLDFAQSFHRANSKRVLTLNSPAEAPSTRTRTEQF